MRLKLIVHLVRKETLERDYERLPYEPLTQDVLGVPVLKVVIQVVAGRNIAVLVEAAVRNTILQLRGIDTYQEFVDRHRRAMGRDSGAEAAGFDAAAASWRFGVAGALRWWRTGPYSAMVWSSPPSLCFRQSAAGVFSISGRKTLRLCRRTLCKSGRGVGPSLSSYTALPLSKLLRIRMPACSNWVSTRYTVAKTDVDVLPAARETRLPPSCGAARPLEDLHDLQAGRVALVPCF